MMASVSISEARRRWSTIVVAALTSPIVVTRYGKPWVLLVVVTARLGDLLGPVDALDQRAAGRDLCRVADGARAGGVPVIDVPARRARVAIMPVTTFMA